MGHCALGEHSFSYIFLWTFLVLSLTLYYTIYLEIDMEEEEIATGMERASGYYCLIVVTWCFKAPPYFALVGEWPDPGSCSGGRNLGSR